MPYDAMVELSAYIGKNGPEVISRDNIPLFQQGLMMQQLNSEKLIVEATIEGSYEKALKAIYAQQDRAVDEGRQGSSRRHDRGQQGLLARA